jgi:polysaccharide pyruvyl transferase WcaK-like protein
VRKGKSNKKIGLFGLFGIGNFGNDGSLEAMINFLRKERPSAELVCICPQPEWVQRCYSVATLPLNWRRPENHQSDLLYRLHIRVPGKLIDLIQTFKQMRKLDTLIVPGTGILDDFGESPGGTPYALFRTFLAAKICGTKILLVSIGAGPIENPINRWLMTTAAKLADYRSYRDATSKAFIKGTGIDIQNDPIYPDLAFGLTEFQSSDSHEPDNDTPTVGIGVMTYQGWRHACEFGPELYSIYLTKLTDFVIWLLDHRYRVRILMGDKSDQKAADDLSLALAKQRPELAVNIVATPVDSLHDVMRQIAEVDFLVATRFHNVVCALMMAKPLVSIGYADKNKALMTDMGLGYYCQHIERLDVDLLIEQFTKLTANRVQIDSRIRETINDYQKLLSHQESLLLSKFL